MRTITLTAEIDGSGRLRLDVPADLPPGPVDVVLIVQPREQSQMHDVRELRGLGREIWQSTEAQAYVGALRDEWER